MLKQIERIITKFKLIRWRRRNKQFLTNTRIIAITGTRGKTTVAHIIRHFLLSSGWDVGLISSEGAWINLESVRDSFSVNGSSPNEVLELIQMLLKKGANTVILECSENLLASNLIQHLHFDSCVVTNIGGEDFADSYVSRHDYADFIFRPVWQILDEGMVVVNFDDDMVDWVKEEASKIPQAIYAIWSSLDEVEDFKQNIKGMEFNYMGTHWNSRMFSKMNLRNILQAIQLCSRYVGMEVMDRALAEFDGVPGRLELVSQKPMVIVDYEYQPTVLASVWRELKNLNPNASDIVSIIGLSGSAPSSRDVLSILAAKNSRLVIFAAQDPGEKHVLALNNRLVNSLEDSGGVVVERFQSHDEYASADKFNLLEKIDRVSYNHDIPTVSFDADSPSSRLDAIDFALKYAKPDDLIIVTGKGNDRFIDFGNVIYEWNDRLTILEIV